MNFFFPSQQKICLEKYFFYYSNQKCEIFLVNDHQNIINSINLKSKISIQSYFYTCIKLENTSKT